MGFPLFEDVVPHQAPMVLLDQIIASDDVSLTTEVIVRPELPLVRDGRWPAWIGIELMAQSIAAFAGLKARELGLPPKVGFLLGTRKYDVESPWFYCGEKLTVRVEVLHQEESGLGVFECEILSSDNHITARLNVFEPDDAEIFLNSKVVP